MTTTWIRRWFIVVGLAVLVCGWGRPAEAQVAVFDAANYAQLIRQIGQGAQQISFLEQQLHAQEQMLASLPQSSLGNLLPMVSETSGLVNDLQGIQQSGTSLLSNLDQAYPTAFTGQTPAQMQNQILAMRVRNRQALTTAMQIQNQIAAQQSSIGNDVQSAESASSGAEGPTQAIQATNQLVGDVSNQLTQQNALLASAERAQAQAALAQASKQAATDEFMTPSNLPLNGKGVGY